MPELPEKLAKTIERLEALPERTDRVEFLMALADRFREVSPEVASRPFDEQARVPECESEAYVWATPLEDGTLRFHFAVENPQGISAKALAVILEKGLSGAPLEQVAAVSRDVVYRIFGRELSLGKGLGLAGMVSMVQAYVRQHSSTNSTGGS